MMPKVVHDLEDEPANTGQRTTAMNASEMLGHRVSEAHTRESG